MTIQLERLNDGSPVDRNFALLQLFLDRVMETGGTRGAGVRFGTASVTTTAATTGSLSVAHGLGKLPAVGVVSGRGNAGLINAEVELLTSTNILLRIGYTDGVARTFSATVDWIVIG